MFENNSRKRPHEDGTAEFHVTKKVKHANSPPSPASKKRTISASPEKLHERTQRLFYKNPFSLLDKFEQVRNKAPIPEEEVATRQKILALFNAGKITLNEKVKRRKEETLSKYDYLNLPYSSVVIPHPTNSKALNLLVYPRERVNEGGTSIVRKALVFALKQENGIWVEDDEVAPKLKARKVKRKNLTTKADFKQEVEILNIIEDQADYAEHFISNGTENILMPFHEGDDLCTLIFVKEINDDAKPYIANDIIEKVIQLHQKGLLHRDLKPDNIMVLTEEGKDFEAKIIDPAFAIPISEAKNQSTIAGTAEYIPCELLSNMGYYASVASDWWAVGAIIKLLFNLVEREPNGKWKFNCIKIPNSTLQIKQFAFIEDANLITDPMLKPIFDFAHRLMDYKKLHKSVDQQYFHNQAELSLKVRAFWYEQSQKHFAIQQTSADKKENCPRPDEYVHTFKNTS